MENQKKKLGRPKGKNPPLTSAERMAITRKRRAIVLEEHEKLGLTVKRFAFDSQLFSGFEDLSRDFGKEITIEDLVHSAMAQYLESEVKTLDEPKLNDEGELVSTFQLAKIKSLIRFKKENLNTDRVKQVLNVHDQPDEGGNE